MKAPNIDPTTVYAYNLDGSKHRANIVIATWLRKEIEEAHELQAELNQLAKDGDYADYENEISRHEQDGFVSALEYVERYLTSKAD